MKAMSYIIAFVVGFYTGVILVCSCSLEKSKNEILNKK